MYRSPSLSLLLTLDTVGAPALSIFVLATTEEHMHLIVGVACFQFLHFLGELLPALNIMCDDHSFALI